MKTLHPELDRAVALVNLGSDRAEDMAAVLESFGENDVELDDAGAAALGAVRRELGELFDEGHRDRAAARVNALLAAHAGPPRLVRHEGWDWHVHVDRAGDASWAEWLAASAGLALATRLAASSGVPWGRCRADGCGQAFVHDGRGGVRHWCSTTCASRERVRRHRRSRRRAGDRDTAEDAGQADGSRDRW